MNGEIKINQELMAFAMRGREQPKRAKQQLIVGNPKKLTRNMLLIIKYLSTVEESIAQKIEMGTNLSQPEVSMAIKQLRARGWINEREEKTKPGKGRPYNIFKLININHIMKIIEEELKTEYANKIINIKKIIWGN